MTLEEQLKTGLSHHRASEFAEAERIYRQILAVQPDHVGALHLLGALVGQAGQPEAALELIGRAIRLKPDHVIAHNNLGNILRDLGRINDAIESFRQAIRLNPGFALAYNNLGIALTSVGQLDEAVEVLRQSIRLQPDLSEAYSNLGNALSERGEVDEAIASYRQAIELKSDFAGAHWNYARLLLKLGKYEEGWKEFEWRLRTPHWMRMGVNFAQSRWTGQDARGKTILLVSDASLGDAMHLIRYAPLVAGRGATVLLECQAELVPLLNRVHGVSKVFACGGRLPPFDWQIPLFSLPLVFGTTMETIPADVPYLSAPAERIEQWAKRLRGDSSFKVGLVWAGSLGRDARSCLLASFAPLGAIPGVSFYGLQKGPEANQPVPAGMRLIQLGDELGDFADTAALVSNLDLVISVDTSVAHLAGGMGRPVWTLIYFDPSFLWLRDRADSPWYPTMRLFRQPRKGDWDSVITRVVDALSVCVKGRA
jgi:Flp pilus assembly protein TadD